MKWLFGLTRARERNPLVCYLRENGPIAYALDLFGHDARERAEAMLAADASWYWKSGVAPRPSAARKSGREWTHLTSWSLAALLEDVIPATPGQSSARILMVGVDPRHAPADLTDDAVARWLKAFGAAAAGPLHALVHRPGASTDFVFVAQQPPEAIRGLLQAWGIDRDRAERRAYPRLQDASLESVTAGLNRSSLG